RPVVAAGELQVGAGVVDLDVELAGGRVDRLRAELELPERADGPGPGGAPREYPRSVLFFVAETHLHVPVAEQGLVEAEPDVVAHGPEIEAALTGGRHARNSKIVGADPGNARHHGIRLVARNPVVLDRIPPVALARVLEAQLPVVEPDVTTERTHPRAGFVVALHQAEVEKPVESLLVPAAVLAEAPAGFVGIAQLGACRIAKRI